MKTLWKSIRITLAFCVVLGVCYVGVLYAVAETVESQQRVITVNDKIVGVENIGQHFSDSIYFWGRPSQCNYDATASRGSNKAVTDKEYLATIENRIDTLLFHHSYLTRRDIPIEMVTASGSGLDPHISPQAAYIQVKRVALARGVSENEIKKIVDNNVESPFLGLFGTAKVNVLKLNASLDSNQK